VFTGLLLEKDDPNRMCTLLHTLLPTMLGKATPLVDNLKYVGSSLVFSLTQASLRVTAE
jgi:chemotaxis receptor (MCP) glutamine deamidase CheD